MKNSIAPQIRKMWNSAASGLPPKVLTDLLVAISKALRSSVLPSAPPLPAVPYKPIRFPEDELAHECSIEWWYWNGHLSDAKGEKYAFMSCLFKADTKLVKLPVLSQLPMKTLYFSHSILSDIGSQLSHAVIDHIAAVSTDSFRKPLLFINYANPFLLGGYVNCAMEESKPFCYHLKSEHVDLELTSRKEPLLIGGKGYIDVAGKKTYYYSLTHLEAKGIVRVNNEEREVKGIVWMDHQWANTRYSKDKWVWFSIQLEGRTEMLCMEYQNEKGDTSFASISLPDGSQEHTQYVRFTPLGESWESPLTHAEYPLSWKIEIPEKGITLTARPLMKNQEILFGVINYWEGSMEIEGEINGKRVKGSGFLELVGFPGKHGRVTFAKQELEKIVKTIKAYWQ